MTTDSAIASLVPPLLGLPVAQKLAVIEALWASFTQSDLDQPLAPWKLAALDASKAQYLAHPESAMAWGTLREQTRLTHPIR